MLTPNNRPSDRKKYWRWLVRGLLVLLAATTVMFIWLINLKIQVLNTPNQVVINNKDEQLALPPLPIGVDPATKTIVENPIVDDYVANYVASNHTKPALGEGWLDRTFAKLIELDWYQNLATPATRILLIQSGEREEEITRNFGRILKWNQAQKTIFTDRLLAEVPAIKNGKLYPGRYVVPYNAGPEEVAVAVAERFDAEIRTRYDAEVASKVSMKEALIIASLIEREAYDFSDMRYISGVIWNRLFINMPLQIDATLQYAKGERSVAAGGRWWSVPRPEDKFIKSPFNTYQNTGLPPEPIANPSIEAIIAALNPRETDCLFYYHTNDGAFHCNATYAEHVAGIKRDLK